MAPQQVKGRGLVSLAEQTASLLRDEIRQGKYAVGQRLADEHSLASKYNISRGTIRQALKILGRERLVVRHQGRGTFVTNPTCGTLGNTRTALLGIMVWEKEYYFGKIIQAASAHAASRGYMLITGSNATPQQEAQHTDAFLAGRLHGVIMSPRPKESLENYDRLVRAGIPVVLVDGYFRDRREDFVTVDNYQGTYIAARYLIEQGHRRLAYLGHDSLHDIPCRASRLRGFSDACEQWGVSPPADWCIAANEHNCPALLDRVLAQEPRPTAFVTFSDTWAVRVVQAARKRGLAVPQQLAVIGFDDSDLARNYDVPLTSVHPEFDQIGHALVDLLIEKIEAPEQHAPRSILIMPHLEVRASTGQAPAVN